MAFDYDDDDDAPVVVRPRTLRTPVRAEPSLPDTPASDEDDDIATKEVSSGWAAAQAQAQADSPFASNLRLDSTQTLIKFLEDGPYANYKRHWVSRPYNCPSSVGRPCPLCDIGHRASATSAFNVAKVAEDGSVTLHSWDVSPRQFGVLRAFANDPKTGPLHKGFFYVNKIGTGQSSQTNIIPVRKSMLVEDGVVIPTDDDLRDLGVYTAAIIRFPKKSELTEIALELSAD